MSAQPKSMPETTANDPVPLKLHKLEHPISLEDSIPGQV